MAHDVELVEQDCRLGCVLGGGVARRLPHVHHRQTNAPRLPLAEPAVEQLHARLRTVRSAEPDRSSANQVAHRDPVGVALSDRDLVDADGLGAGRASLDQLRTHVLLVQLLDRVPIQIEFFGHIFDRADPTAPTDEPGKPLCIERIVGKEVESLPLHLAATATQHPTDLELQIDPRVAAGQIAHAPGRAVVPAKVRATTFLADGFFERRTSVMTRAHESPKTPRTNSSGRKPGNRYASNRRLRLCEAAIAKSCHISRACQTLETRVQ